MVLLQATDDCNEDYTIGMVSPPARYLTLSEEELDYRLRQLHDEWWSEYDTSECNFPESDSEFVAWLVKCGWTEHPLPQIVTFN